jgi:ArsR family transcriptional regulator
VEDEEWNERLAMKKKKLEFHAEFCKTFSSPSRLEILCLLKEGEMTVSDITKKLCISKSSVSQHLNLMRMMGILKPRREGVNIYYMLANKRLAQACSLMQKALEQLMEGSCCLKKEELVAMKGEITR